MVISKEEIKRLKEGLKKQEKIKKNIDKKDKGKGGRLIDLSDLTDLSNSNKSYNTYKSDKSISQGVSIYKDLFKQRGEKALILWYLFNKTLSALDIDEVFNLSKNRTQTIINRNKDSFSQVGKEGQKKLWTASQNGKRFVENIIKEEEEKNKPTYAEEQKEKSEEEKFEIKKYLEQENKNILNQASEDFIKIDFKSLSEYSPELSDKVLDEPKEIIEFFEQCLKEFYDLDNKIIFINLPKSAEMNLGDIRAKHKNKLVIIEGLINQQSQTHLREIESKFECPSCGCVIGVLQREEKFREPSRCSCGRRGGFKQINSVEIDEQKMILEEPLDMVNREVQNMNVTLQGDLTKPNKNHFKNVGERVLIIGIVEAKTKALKMGGLSTEKTLHIKALDIKPSKKEYCNIQITEEDEKKILKFAKENKEPHKKITKMLFKNIEGMNEVKEALILQHFGGVRKVLSDKTGRGDIHILIIGDPGIAKSDLARASVKIAPKSRIASGAGASNVGLIGIARKNEFLKSYEIIGGTLPKTNGGMVFLDEFDKMEDEDRKGIHTAMEQQECPIDKGDCHTTLKTQCSILACANTKYTEWDLNSDLLKQVNLPSSLKGRFDFIFPLKDIPNIETDGKIAKTILNPNKKEIELDFLRKYIIYGKKIKPILTDEAKVLVENFYKEIRQITKDKRSLITARDINAYIRLGEAVAKSRLSDKVTKEDIEKVIRLHRFCLGEFGVNIPDEIKTEKPTEQKKNEFPRCLNCKTYLSEFEKQNTGLKNYCTPCFAKPEIQGKIKQENFK